MSFSIIFTLLILVVANVVADKMQCPPNSKGQYPNCICPEQKEYPYDQVNNICPIKINVDQACPIGSEGQFPNCICQNDRIFDLHTTKCVTIDKNQCPVGSEKVNNKCVCAHRNGFKYEFDEIFWICRPWYLPAEVPKTLVPVCPPNQHFDDNGKCIWNRCPHGYTSPNGYWPNCIAPPTCGAYQTGDHPNCTWLPCPGHYQTKTGYWPDCRTLSCTELGNCPLPPPPPCPLHHYRSKDGKCVRIPCAAPNEDKYQPDCPVFKPRCPAEYPGVWPLCNIYIPNIYASTPATLTTPATEILPKCPPNEHLVGDTCVIIQCPPGLVGIPPNCDCPPNMRRVGDQCHVKPPPTCSNTCYCSKNDKIVHVESFDSFHKYKRSSNKN